MSASSKKKLRKEQAAAALTEKQLNEKKEAKKLKAYSVIFIAIMLVVAITAITVMTVKGIQSSGIIQKNTVAATVNDHKINALHLNYYYKDTINSSYNEWTSTYGEMATAYVAMMLGLDMTLPLDEQYFDESTTWADYFLNIALERAQADYAMYDEAMKANFVMSETDQANLDANLGSLSFYAMMYGYSDVESYLDAMYGPGASLKTYTEYVTISAIASAYYNYYYTTLSYSDAEMREYEKDIYHNFSSFTYDSYYLTYNTYLEGGEEDENGTVTYTDKQKEAARAACKTDADILGQATNVEELDAAIASLPINEGKETASVKNVDLIYTSVASSVRDWLSDESRQDGDVAVIPSTVTTVGEDGTETEELYGYYVVIYHSRNENTTPMGNVRHLLVKFEAGEDGTITDEAKAAAKEEADGYLKQWKEGPATEESFIELVQAHSDDGSASTGGLFEDINPSSAYVANFRNWAIDPSRKAGDAEVIETEYGYHVMYYVGADELSYRDMLITTELQERDVEAWYNSVMEANPLTRGDFSYVDKSLIMAAG